MRGKRCRDAPTKDVKRKATKMDETYKIKLCMFRQEVRVFLKKDSATIFLPPMGHCDGPSIDSEFQISDS